MRRHTTLRWLAVFTAALALVLPAVPAYAAPAPLAKYDVRAILTSDGQRALLVTAELPDTAKLPAEVAVAVPKGATMNWVGEILGGDASKDPQAQYTLQSGKDYDTVVFTLKQARIGQAEMLYPQGQTSAGAGTKAVLDYTPNLAVPAVDLSIEVPSGAKVSGLSAGLKQISVGGGTFYQKSFTDVKAGQKISASLQYSGGTIAPPQQQGGAQAQPQGSPQTVPTSSSGPASLPVVLIVLMAIVAGTYYMMKRVSQPADDAQPAPVRASRAKPDRHDDDGDDGYFRDEEAAPSAAPPKKQADKKPASAGAGGTTAKAASAKKAGSAPAKPAASAKKAPSASKPSTRSKRSA